VILASSTRESFCDAKQPSYRGKRCASYGAKRKTDQQEPVRALEARTRRRVLSENGELLTKREDLRLQGDTGSKTGGYQSEKGDEKRAHRDTTRISRMLGIFVFSPRTEFW
jgi:hypothetical protein